MAFVNKTTRFKEAPKLTESLGPGKYLGPS